MQRIILIVDDNDMNRMILKKMLIDDYDILEAVNGQEALDILRESSEGVAAVLLDLGMPVMDGYEFLKIVKNDEVLKLIPIVVTTGDNENEVEMKALTLGANDFAIKPYNTGIIKLRLLNLISLRETSAIVNAARKDALTGLLSRTGFLEEAAKMISSHEAGYYVMTCCDIDRFKVINDQYGTKKGDEVLKYVASFFKKLDELGGICCRVNADNFAALFPCNYDVNEKINEMQRQVAALDGTVNPVTFSIGRYVINDLSLTPSAMYDRAAMAKATVKGRYDIKIATYDEKMRKGVLLEQKITSEMKAALDNENFEVWFQPIYNHSKATLIGAEALVRWNHPQEGIKLPGSFIPIFERNGFMYELDKYVWEKVCVFLRKWLDAGYSPLPVSVNISHNDFFSKDLVYVITELVNKYNIPLSLLRLEMSELSALKFTEQITQVARSFIDLGFTVVIDDFGDGYSSFNTLMDIPAQIVKIDMSFFDSTKNTERGGNILESIVRMLKWLGTAVVAEGVETIEQADFLKSIGCSYVQGFLYKKVISAIDYERLMTQTQKEDRINVLTTVKTLDNSTFWNPYSMDTLIFNSYVGGACVIEFYNGKCTVIRANDKYAQIISGGNISVDEALEIQWSEHLDTKNTKSFHDAVKRAIETNEEVTGEFVFNNMPHCNGNVYLRVTLRVIASAVNRHLLYCTNENVTTQRQAEKQTFETSEQLSVIMSNINGSVTAIVLNQNDEIRFVFANDKYYSMLGYTREEFEREKKNPFDFLHANDKKRVIRETKQASLTGLPLNIIYRAVRKDKKVIWIQSNISITPISGISDSVQIAVGNDITAQVEAEQREHQISQRMQAIMDNVGCGITAVQSDGAHMKFLFSNDRYYDIMGYTREQYMNEVSNSYSLIHCDDRQRINDVISKLVSTGKSNTSEYRAIRRDCKEIWISVVQSITHFDGIDGPVLLTIYNDITTLKTSEQMLTETAEQLHFLNDVSGNLLSESDAEAGIINVMQKLLSFFVGSRVYVFEFDYERQLCSNTYEICADGISGEKDILQNIPINIMSFWISCFEHENHIIIDDVDFIDSDRSEEKRILAEQGIDTLTAVPLRRDGKLIGFIGIDDPKRRQSLVDRLDAIGNYIAVMLTRRDLDRKIKSDNKALINLMNDTPGGFARISVSADLTMRTVYVNDGYCRMFGFDNDEIMSVEKEDALYYVHPDDREPTRNVISDVYGTTKTYNIKLRHRNKDGKYIWIHVSGRVTSNEAGEKFINTYFADLSEQEKRKMSFLETVPFILEAIMKASTDLTFAKDADLKYICCSDMFAKLVGLNDSSEIVGKTDYDIFEKKYADKFTADDKQVMETGKSITDVIEVIPSDDEFAHYSNTSKHVLRDTVGNTIGVYGIGRDVTQFRTTFEQLRLLTESIPGGIAAAELIGDKIRLIYYNEGFFKISGYTREEFEDKCSENPCSLVFEEDMYKIKRAAQHLISNENVTADCTYRSHNKDGSYRWYNLRATVTEKYGDAFIVNIVKFDITDQKHAEESIRIHEKEMKIAMSQMGKMICEYDPKTLTMTMPKAYTDLYGFASTLENFPYCVVKLNQLDPLLVDSYIQFYESIRNGKKKGSYEARIRRRDGLWHWEHYKFVNIFDDKNKPVKAILSVEEITEQKEMNRKYEEELQLRYEIIRDSVIYYVIDLTTGVIESYFSQFNDVAGMQTNAISNDAIRNGILANIDEADRSIVQNTIFTSALQKAYENGERTAVCEYRRTLSSLGFRWVKATANIMKKPNSNTVVAFIYIRDIDREKKDIIAIQNLMNKEIESVLILDTNTGVAHFAKAYASFMPELRTSDFLFDEAIANNIKNSCADEEIEECCRFFNTANLIKTLDKTNNAGISYRVKCSNGSVLRKRTSVSYLDETKHEIVISTSDITDIYKEEQRQKQQLREAIKTANEANNAKSNFLARISHDIRTPLNAVLALSGSEMNDMEKEKRLRENLDKIHSSGTYLLGIINNVLDMSKIEQNKMIFTPVQYSFGEFESTVTAIVGELCKDKQINFVFKTDLKEVHDIVIDKVKFNQIFMNLLSNAVKFTPQGGTIEFIASDLGEVKNGVTSKRFIVRDNGIGMSKDFLPHAFDTFSQEYRDDIVVKSQGTGLGLAIVKDIVEMMDGVISIESEIGKGTTFTIDIPLRLAVTDKISFADSDDDDSSLKGLRILLCEDNRLNTEITVRLLSHKGCIIECADNGLKGFEMYKAAPEGYYDAVIMDIRMPVMNGIESAEAIRTSKRGDSLSIPIIAMTADAFTEDERTSKKAGMNEHISKPVEPRLLFDALKRVVAKKK